MLTDKFDVVNLYSNDIVVCCFSIWKEMSNLYYSKSHVNPILASYPVETIGSKFEL